MSMVTAQQHISPEEAVKCFTMLYSYISSAMDETDVDMLWNGSEEGGNVRGSVRG